MLAISSFSLSFVPPMRAMVAPVQARASVVTASIFEQAMKTYEAENPWMAKYGFGPSVKAERWNGRHVSSCACTPAAPPGASARARPVAPSPRRVLKPHPVRLVQAMFGWMAILATGVAKSHGLLPEGDIALTYEDWGGLAQQGMNTYISKERAIIMIAHVHALAFSFAAAFGPQVLGDSLTLLDGEKDEEPYGFMPPLQLGLTPAAEMANGRVAMVGLISVVATSAITGMDVLQVVDIGTGGNLLTHPMF